MYSCAIFNTDGGLGLEDWKLTIYIPIRFWNHQIFRLHSSLGQWRHIPQEYLFQTLSKIIFRRSKLSFMCSIISSQATINGADLFRSTF